jgi:hypothetical protein
MKHFRLLILGIGLALYALLLWKLDFTRAWGLLSQVKLWLFALAILAGLPEILCKALRLRLLARNETHLTLKQGLHLFLSGQPMALVTPGKLGDVTRVWLLKHLSKRPMPECLAVHTSDKIFDFSALAILATIALWGWFGKGLIHSSGALSAAGGVLAGLLLAVAMLNPSWFKPLANFLIHQWVPPEQADPLKHHGREFLEKLKHRLSPNHRRFFEVFLLSLLAWEFAIFRAWVCSQALGIELPLGQYLLWAPLVIMIELLPITVLGFGTREWALIFIFGSATLPNEALVSFSLLTLLAGPVTTALLGLPSSMDILREPREKKP